jgi:hypothetical protein
MIKLYHYSSQDFKGYIEPGFFGANSYSNNSARLSGVKRSYFYLDRAGREYYFEGARYCYIAEIKESRLYNLNIDPLKLAGRNIRDIFAYIKRLGYKGLIGSNGYKDGVIFYPIKIKQRKTLTEAGRYAIL